MTLRVTTWTVHDRSFQLAEPVETARRAWTHRPSFVVRLVDESGRTGFGEAAPPAHDSDAEFVETGRDLRQLVEVVVARRFDAAQAVESVAEFLDAAGGVGSVARFAVETALLDLAGQSVGLPIAALLSGVRAPRSIEVSALLSTSSPDRALGQARDFAAAGFRTMKVKIGRRGRWSEEVELLGALHDEFGEAVRIRADANCAWSAAEARARLDELAPLGLEFVEQPVAPSELMSMTCAPVTLAADETLALPGALDQIIASRACAVVVLKPAVLGGAIACIDMARRAHGAGLAVVVTHSLDGPVAIRAATHLAQALDAPPLACGLGTSHLPPDLAGPAKSVIDPFTAPGLGLPAEQVLP